MTTQSSTTQVIYINWNLRDHTYTMTINLSSNPQYWALESLENWAKYNCNRVESWSVDGNTVATEESINTIRDLINTTLKRYLRK